MPWIKVDEWIRSIKRLFFEGNFFFKRIYLNFFKRFRAKTHGREDSHEHAKRSKIFTSKKVKEAVKVKRSTAPAEPRPLNISFQSLFNKPHEFTLKFQQKAAEALFSLIEVDYVPSRLRGLFEEYDAYYAVQLYLESLNFSYGELMTSKKSRSLLNDIIYIILDADVSLEGSGLSDEPLYKVLERHDIEAAEDCIDRLHLLSPIAKALTESTIVFPGFQKEFYATAKKYLEDWPRFSIEDIKSLSEAFNAWRELQKQYDDYCSKVMDLITSINEHISPHSEYYKTFQAIILKFEETKKATEEGSTEAAIGIEALDELVNDLVQLENLVTDRSKKYSRHEEKDKDKAKSESEEEYKIEIEKSFRNEIKKRIASSPAASNEDILKKAYRVLALRYHPDPNPGIDKRKFIVLQQIFEEWIKTKIFNDIINNYR